MTQKQSMLNPNVFVLDENSAAFIAHIKKRVAKAKRGDGVLSKDAFKRKLDTRIKALKNAAIYR